MHEWLLILLSCLKHELPCAIDDSVPDIKKCMSRDIFYRVFWIFFIVVVFFWDAHLERQLQCSISNHINNLSLTENLFAAATFDVTFSPFLQQIAICSDKILSLQYTFVVLVKQNDFHTIVGFFYHPNESH